MLLRCGVAPRGIIVDFCVGVAPTASSSATDAGTDKDGATGSGSAGGSIAVDGIAAAGTADGLYDRTRKGGAGRSTEGSDVGADSGGPDDDTCVFRVDICALALDMCGPSGDHDGSDSDGSAIRGTEELEGACALCTTGVTRESTFSHKVAGDSLEDAGGVTSTSTCSCDWDLALSKSGDFTGDGSGGKGAFALMVPMPFWLDVLCTLGVLWRLGALRKLGSLCWFGG